MGIRTLTLSARRPEAAHLVTRRHAMKNFWFQRWGWLPRPVSWQGWLVVGLALLFCAQIFRALDRHSHSASDTLYHFFPYFTCCFLLVDWVARHTSGPRPS